MLNFDQQKLVCTLSLEQNGFRLSFIYCIIGVNMTIWSELGDLDPVLRLLRLYKWALPAVYLVSQCIDFDQTAEDTLLGRGKEVIRFRWPWPNYKVTTLLRLWKWAFFAVYLSSNPMHGFWQNCQNTLLGHGKELVTFCWIDPIFVKTHKHITMLWCSPSSHL